MGTPGDQRPRFTSAPPLALMAVLFGVYELLMTRVALRVSDLEWETLTRLEWSRCGALARNIAATAGLIALGAALLSFYRDGKFAPLPRRLLLMLFGVVVWFMVAAATGMSQESVKPRLVLMCLGAGNVLAVLASLEALRFPSPRGIRLGLFAWTICLFASFASLVLALAGASTGWQAGLNLASYLRDTGEIAFLVTGPILGASVLLIERRAIQLVTGVVAAALLAIPLGMILQLPSSEYSVLIYGALRLSRVLDSAPGTYLFALPLLFGSGVAILISRDATRRLVGAALLAFFSAGYGPSSPVTILMMVLGTTMLAQAVIGMAWQAHDHVNEEAPSPSQPIPVEASPIDEPEPA